MIWLFIGQLFVFRDFLITFNNNLIMIKSNFRPGYIGIRHAYIYVFTVTVFRFVFSLYFFNEKNMYFLDIFE